MIAVATMAEQKFFDTPVQYSSYDVFLMPSNSSNSGLPVCLAPGNHVGNQRFQVLLSIYREKYIQADMLGDKNECNNIAFEVMETFAYKCIPQGRFFEYSDEECQWREIQIGPATIDLIQKALKTPPIDRSSDTRSSMCGPCEPQCYEEPLKCYEAPLKSAPEERKVKRARRDSGFTMRCLSTSEDLVSSPDPFDVICEEGKSGVTIKSENHVGNNRVKILLDLRLKAYEVAKQDNKPMIANEVVSSIVDDAGGRFLRVDNRTGLYTSMSRDSAVNCIMLFFDTATQNQKEEREKLRATAVQRLKDQKMKKAKLGLLEKRKSSEMLSGSESPPPVGLDALQQNSVSSRAA